MNDDRNETPAPIDPEWGEIAEATEESTHRSYCLGLIDDELAKAAAAGVPEGSAAVRILQRLRLAVELGQ
jgi:hypothetical protein